MGEGRETEAIYFRGLRCDSSVAQKFVLTVKGGEGKNPAKTIELALHATKQDADYDRVVCVIDAESPSCRSNVEDARKLVAKKPIELLVSNPCFEVWLLSHFKRTSKAFHGAGEVEKELDREWRARFAQGYGKTARDLYERLKDCTEQAIKNAKDVREKDHAGKPDILDCNSATDVYQLVEDLLGSPS